MLSPEERKLLTAILLVLLLGAMVKACRTRATVELGPKEVLPSLDATTGRSTPVD